MEQKLTNEQISNRLAAFAMMGQSVREHFKQNGVDLDQVMEKCMNNAKDIENPVERLQTAMSEYKTEFLKLMPLGFRCNFILNTLNSASKNNGNFKEEDIDWNKINEILFKNPIPYDYNLVKKVETIEELSHLSMEIVQSEFLNSAWYVQKCKTCGETFYLTSHEISFYIDKNLNVPRRCKNCIDESKGKESFRQRKKKEEQKLNDFKSMQTPDNGKTAMQIAYEKALKKKENKK